MCLNEPYSRVQVGKYLSDMFPITNGLKQVNALSHLLFSCVVEYATGRIQVTQDILKLNGTHQILVDADVVNTWGESVHNIKKTT